MLPEVSLICIKEQKQIMYKTILISTENVCELSLFDGGIIYLASASAHYEYHVSSACSKWGASGSLRSRPCSAAVTGAKMASSVDQKKR